MTTDEFWELVHSTIESMDDHERGFYKGFVEASFYAAANNVFRVEIDPRATFYCYDPEGKIVDPVHPFYSPIPEPPPTLREVFFDPQKYLAVLCESDREAALYYARFSVFNGKWFVIELACTEGDSGVPWKDIPWCDFAGAAAAWAEVNS